MTSPQPSPLNDLLPEIYPLIAAHIPLHSTPSTLLALALVNHHISEIVLPLLYSRLILKNGTDALKMIQRLMNDPKLGQVVREIHLLSNISLATDPCDIVTDLENLIKSASLPYIHTLGLHLHAGWRYDQQHLLQFGKLRSDFWINLKKNCPRLRTLRLGSISEDKEDPWLYDSGLLEIEDITNLSLEFRHNTLTQAGSEKLLKNIGLLSANLHTLDLSPFSSKGTPVSPLLEMNFPKLRYLSLVSFTLDNLAQAMGFWERHPLLEYLWILSDANDDTRWFSTDSVLPGKFLPNLKHLMTQFYNVQILAPILSQLVSLTIFDSVNAQIPYLLRSILSDGLPNLKSLVIDQESSDSANNVNIEGALWYETEDGKFHEAEAANAPLSVLNGYIRSITRGAPNLEEIEFLYGTDINCLDDLANIALEIAGLSKLRRLYYDGVAGSEELNEPFISNARTLAEACNELTMIVNTSSLDLPYVAAVISRTESGEVRSIDVRNGYGTQIGGENEAFPM